MMQRRAALKLIAGVTAANVVRPAAAQPFERSVKPDDVGLSRDSLLRLTAWYQREVDAKRIPGAVVAVGRGGKLAWLEAVGLRDRDLNAPMRTDTLFRMASMTKPITSLAATMLVEESKVMLWHPVSRYLPEFKEATVGTERAPIEREATVLDLLRHTSGLTYGAPAPAGAPVQQAYAAAKVSSMAQTGDQFIANIAGQPLARQPGTYWEYSHSTDVLGRVVEVASGQPLDVFFSERIFQPLGMAHTAFWAGQDRAERLVQPQVDPLTKARQEMPSLIDKPAWFWGGHGLLSTASDYARLCQMFLNKGRFGGAHLLSRKYVDLMTADHLPPGTQFDAGVLRAQAFLAPVPAIGNGFGLGFVVRTAEGRNPVPGSVGDYSWAGAWGTYFWIDPKEDLYAIMLIQGPADRMHYRYAMRQLVYDALV